jgi:putative addiction module killer protein
LSQIYDNSNNMENRERILEMYVRKDGKTPYRDWFLGLRDKRVAVKIAKRLDLLTLGGFGKHRVLEGGLVELKIDYGPGIRIYAGLAGPVLVILLCGGDKSTQHHDIALAKEYWDDYRGK